MNKLAEAIGKVCGQVKAEVSSAWRISEKYSATYFYLFIMFT